MTLQRRWSRVNLYGTSLFVVTRGARTSAASVAGEGSNRVSRSTILNISVVELWSRTLTLAKPQDVFGRGAEWSDLADFASSPLPGLRIAVVYGRRRHDASTAKLGLFSTSGFTDEARAAAARSAGGILLVGLDDLYGEPHAA